MRRVKDCWTRSNRCSLGMSVHPEFKEGVFQLFQDVRQSRLELTVFEKISTLVVEGT